MSRPENYPYVSFLLSFIVIAFHFIRSYWLFDSLLFSHVYISVVVIYLNNQLFICCNIVVTCIPRGWGFQTLVVTKVYVWVSIIITTDSKGKGNGSIRYSAACWFWTSLFPLYDFLILYSSKSGCLRIFMCIYLYVSFLCVDLLFINLYVNLVDCG